MDQLLTEKNAVIHDLEQRIRQLEHELRLSKESASRLRHSLQAMEGLRLEGGADGDIQAEVLTLHETLDLLSQQLATASEESQTLRHK